jgi:IMP dehydrogenase/GMP reductase
VDNLGMAPGRGVPQIDQALEAVVGAINALTEPQDGGPGVVLTLGGLVISGTIQQDQTVYIHLTEARVVAAGVSPLPCCRDALARTARRDFRVVVRPSWR